MKGHRKVAFLLYKDIKICSKYQPMDRTKCD